MTYTKYRFLIKELLDRKESTAKNGSLSLYNYSLLNDKRMDRLDKKALLSNGILLTLKQLKQKQTWLVITEGWCGDAAQNLPYINKIAEYTDKIDLRIVLRDQHLDLMDQFLTDGNQAIPKLIALDENNNTLFTWGPRPSKATKMVHAFKKEHGKLTDEFKKDLQVWYNKNKGENLYQDFIELLA